MGLKPWVIQPPPKAQELNRVSILHPVLDELIRPLTTFVTGDEIHAARAGVQRSRALRHGREFLFERKLIPFRSLPGLDGGTVAMAPGQVVSLTNQKIFPKTPCQR